MKITRLAKLAVVALLLSPFFVSMVSAEDVFNEDGSIVVVEIESQPINSAWTQGVSTVDGTDITYYTPKVDKYNDPGYGTLTYKIQINNPGIYRFQWHSQVGAGTSATDSNDDWLKILADDFYGQKNSDKPQTSAVGHIIHPNPTSSNKKETEGYPNGASKNGWFKVYSTGSAGTQPWKWRSFTSDNDPHAIYTKFDNAGVYTVQISARSSNHFLNRFVMYKESVHSESSATSLTRVESTLVIDESAALLIDKLSEVSVFPNPSQSTITVRASDKDFLRFELIDLSGQVIAKGMFEGSSTLLDVSSLDKGLYLLNCFANNGRKKVLSFVKE